MILITLLALWLALPLAQGSTPQPVVRPLTPGGSIQDSLAGGEKAVFSIDVPPGMAARVVVRQQGIDLGLTLRRKGSDLPLRGLDYVAGTDGDERSFPAIEDAPVTWNVFLSTSLPHAARGGYTISFDLAPADDRARAMAAARQQYHHASDTAWAGDGPAFHAAQDEYAAAAAAAAAAGDDELAAESTYQCARTHDNLGDQPGAIELQLRALSMFRALGRRDREARALDRLGDLSRKVGEVAESERYFRQALPIAQDVGDITNVADILNNSGLLMLVLGRAEEAIQQFASAIPLAQELNSANVEAALTSNMAESYAVLGQYDKAIETYQRGLEVVQRLKIPRRTAVTLYNLAHAQFENNDRAGADQSLKNALDLYQQSDDHPDMAIALVLQGRMLHTDGASDQAIELFARAQPWLHDARNRFAETRLLTDWAAVDLDRGDAASALPKADEALRLARLISNPAAEHEALYARARALDKQGRLDEAIESISAAVAGVETMRGTIVRNDLRTSYLTTVRGYFDLFIDLLQRKGSTAEAFEVSERARARTLLDGLAESAAKISKGVDKDLLARRAAVQAQLNAREAYRAQVALVEGEKSTRALAVGRDVARLLEEWTNVRAQIRTASPAYAALQMPEPIDAARVQRSLVDAGTALVEYHLGADRSYAWVIDRSSLTIHTLPAARLIEVQARRYHELLSRDVDALAPAAREQLSHDIAAAGRRLAADVWRPLSARVSGKRLLIVADGALQYVPFAALPDASGQPLLVHHEVVYLPSASVLETIRQTSRPMPARAAAAVFADPVFSKNDPRFAERRDSSEPSESRGADGGTYARLRFSRREAEAIAAAVPGAFQALDFSAAKKTLAGRDLRKYNILHFATHGSLNTERPELSGLVLSLVDQNGASVDGFLRLHEIYNLDLNADLVVLSACRTALGKDVHGEGLIGLTRGFMYAGASRVVSSVWNVDDRASALLMSRFYEDMLQQHLAPAAALRQAQLSLLTEARWANPHYWAAFGLQGEWR